MPSVLLIHTSNYSDDRLTEKEKVESGKQLLIVFVVEGCFHGVHEVDQLWRLPVVFQVRWEDVFVDFIIARRACPSIGNLVLPRRSVMGWEIYIMRPHG